MPLQPASTDEPSQICSNDGSFFQYYYAESIKGAGTAGGFHSRSYFGDVMVIRGVGGMDEGSGWRWYDRHPIRFVKGPGWIFFLQDISKITFTFIITECR